MACIFRRSECTWLIICSVHLGVKPYACSMCDMRFFHRYHLQRHSLTHTGMCLSTLTHYSIEISHTHATWALLPTSVTKKFSRINPWMNDELIKTKYRGWLVSTVIVPDYILLLYILVCWIGWLYSQSYCSLIISLLLTWYWYVYT